MWNNDDPDKSGYGINKLSKSQLCCVESEFERIISKICQNSEQSLKGNRRRNHLHFPGPFMRVLKNISLFINNKMIWSVILLKLKIF